MTNYCNDKTEIGLDGKQVDTVTPLVPKPIDVTQDILDSGPIHLPDVDKHNLKNGTKGIFKHVYPTIVRKRIRAKYIQEAFVMNPELYKKLRSYLLEVLSKKRTQDKTARMLSSTYDGLK